MPQTLRSSMLVLTLLAFPAASFAADTKQPAPTKTDAKAPADAKKTDAKAPADAKKTDQQYCPMAEEECKAHCRSTGHVDGKCAGYPIKSTCVCS